MDLGLDLVHDILDIDVLDDLNLEQNRKRKLYKARENPFLLDDDSFKEKYRFTKNYVRRITNIVRDDITQDPRGGSIPCNLQVLAALCTWARNEVQDYAADLHGLSQQTVANICHRVGTALARRSQDFIKMPATNAEQQSMMADFRKISGFRNVIGAIDGTHIRIKKVPGEMSQFYINRKGYFSLNVQVICDASLYIRDIVARWRGSTHDSRIFRESRIKQRLELGEFKGRLIGDSDYPCTPYLFTPLLHPSTPAEERYNRAHIHTRNVVERCFEVWKQRFKCLQKGFSNSLENTKIYIVALAVLHNIAIEMGEENDQGPPLPPEEEGGIAEEDRPQNLLNGQAARTAFIRSYF